MMTHKCRVCDALLVTDDNITMITTRTWEIGDCLELLPSIETGSIDLILCDLPYGTTACAWDTVIPFVPLWKEYERIIKDNGAIVLTASQPFTTDLINSNRKLFRYEWIWEKHQAANFINAKKMPLKIHENVCVFYKHLPIYNPQCQRKLPKNLRKKASIPTNDDIKIYGNTKRIIDNKSDIRGYPHSIQNFGNEQGLHATQKPVSMFEYFIKTYTNEGDTVHDSCLGSGTTLEACLRTNRNCIGFEISDEWEHLYWERSGNHTPSLESYCNI